MFGERKNRGHITSHQQKVLSNMQVFVLVVKALHDCCCSLKRHYPCERCPFRLRHFVCTFCKLFTNSIETKLTRSRRIKELEHCAVGMINVTSHKAPKTTAAQHHTIDHHNVYFTVSLVQLYPTQRPLAMVATRDSLASELSVHVNRR